MRRSAVAKGWAGMGGLEKVAFVIYPEDVGGVGRLCVCGAAPPGKILQATKADIEQESWEDRMAALSMEYGQVLSANMKVEVLCALLPKDLQEKVLDECAVNWDETPETEGGVLFTKIRGQIKNMPVEVTSTTRRRSSEEAYMQFMGKGGKKGTGKGLHGHCCCGKGKGKGKGWSKGNYGKGYGEDGYYHKGEQGKGGMQRACFGCGSAEHLLKDCPKKPQIRNVVDEAPRCSLSGACRNPDEGQRVRFCARSCEKGNSGPQGEESLHGVGGGRGGLRGVRVRRGDAHQDGHGLG